MQVALAESMWRDGLFSRPIVARLTRQQALELLALKNTLKRDQVAPFAVEDLTPADTSGEYFDVLIAGERRIRAARFLCAQPDFHSRNGHDASPLAEAFRRALRKGKVTVELAQGEWLDPHRFLGLQNKENSYHPPSTEELAAGYRSWYDQLCLTEPGLTVREFAKRVGRAPETVRGYFRYLEVDPAVRSRLQSRLGKGLLAQSLEYARLARVARALEDERVEARRRRVGLVSLREEDEIRALCKARAEHFAKTLLAEIDAYGYSAGRIRKEIDAWRDSQVTPQIGLFASSEDEEERVEQALTKRRATAIDGRLTASIDVFVVFVRQLTHRFERGELGLPTSPYTAHAVIRAVLALHEVLLVLIPIIRRHLEHPDWSGRRRPAPRASLRAAEEALRAEDVAPLQAELRANERREES